MTFQGNKSVLRRLGAPVYRYGDPLREPLDGAVFVFAQATDPELLLLLEARVEKSGSQWQSALARQTMWVLEVHLDERPIWAVQKWDRATSHPRQTYFDIPRQRDD